MTRGQTSYVNRIAAECDVPGCWPCTLLRVSVRLQWLVLLIGWGIGLATGVCAGVVIGWWWVGAFLGAP